MLIVLIKQLMFLFPHDEYSVLDYQLLDVEIPTINIVGSLVQAGVPVLVYSGDQDSVIPLTGSRTLVSRLAKRLGLRTSVPYRVWFAGQQVHKHHSLMVKKRFKKKKKLTHSVCCFRLVAGLKSMEMSCHLQLCEELHMKSHSHSLIDH